MKPHPFLLSCGCGEDLSRRDFLKTTVSGLAFAAAGSIMVFEPRPLHAAASLPKGATSETLVATLYKSLTDQQRAAVAFPFDHPLRSKVDNNWFITDKKIGRFFSADQQEMIHQIFLGLHSPEYATRVMNQVQHDNKSHGGFGGCSVALFGEPGTGKFEFVLTGRHCTRRCDGDSVAGAAFGGPIFYGHAAQSFYEKANHPGNAYWYQALRANQLYEMLDGKQRKAALLGDPRREQGTDTVKLTGKKDKYAGLSISELSADQKEEFAKVLADVLAPFRKPDADEALKLIKANGIDNLSISFYKNRDIGHDGVWDVWQIEGPAMLWFFRGAPHVHTWVNVKQSA